MRYILRRDIGKKKIEAVNKLLNNSETDVLDLTLLEDNKLPLLAQPSRKMSLYKFRAYLSKTTANFIQNRKKNQLESQIYKVKKAEKKLKNIEKLIKEKKEKISQFESDIAQNKQILDEKRIEVQAKSKILVDKKNEISTKAKSYKQNLKDIERVEKEIKSLNHKISASSLNIEKENKAKELQNDFYKTLSQEKEQKEKQIAEIQSKIETIKNEKKQLADSSSELREIIKELAQDHQDQSVVSDELAIQRASAEKSFSELQEERKIFEQKLENLKLQDLDNRKRYKENIKESQHISSEISRLHETYNHYIIEKTESEERLCDLQDTIEEKKADLQVSSELVAREKREIDNFHAKIKKIEQTISDLNQQIDENNKTYQQSLDSKLSLEAKLLENVEKKDEKTKDLKKIENHIIKISNYNKELGDDLKNQLVDISKLSRKLTNIKLDLQKTRENYKELKERETKNKKIISFKNHKCSKMIKEIKDIRSLIKTKKVSLSDLDSRLEEKSKALNQEKSILANVHEKENNLLELLKEKNEKIIAQSENILAIAQTLNEKKQKIEKYKEENHKLQSSVGKNDLLIKDHRSHSQQLSSELKKVENIYKKVSEEYKEKNEFLITIDKKIKHIQKKIKQRKQEVVVLKDDEKQCVANIESKRLDLSQLTKEFNSLHSTLNQKRESYQLFSNRLENTENELLLLKNKKVSIVESLAEINKKIEKTDLKTRELKEEVKETKKEYKTLKESFRDTQRGLSRKVGVQNSIARSKQSYLEKIKKSEQQIRDFGLKNSAASKVNAEKIKSNSVTSESAIPPLPNKSSISGSPNKFRELINALKSRFSIVSEITFNKTSSPSEMVLGKNFSLVQESMIYLSKLDISKKIVKINLESTAPMIFVELFKSSKKDDLESDIGGFLQKYDCYALRSYEESNVSYRFSVGLKGKVTPKKTTLPTPNTIRSNYAN